MKELKETVALMTSADYKERFQAEYYQLETRYLKLKNMCEKWDEDELDFEPTCPRGLYDKQLEHMLEYLHILVDRANMENIYLELDKEISEILSIATC